MILSSTVLNATGIMITAMFSSVMRQLLVPACTLMLWVFGLTVYYCFSPSSVIAESWTTGSWLQLFGFVLLVFGQLFYADVFVPPCAHNKQKQCSEGHEPKMHEVSPQRSASSG